mmetsp:Transcript_39385/g.61946  ORF Transcript_39385/g.61946 Transcript_39385/m.61946 type:complete len:227 (-) Transcript_39385:354-1034(-)
MTQAKRGDVFHHDPWLFVNATGNLNHLVRNEVESGRGLLEIILSCRSDCKELFVDPLTQTHQCILVDGLHEALQCFLEDLGIDLRSEHAFHVLPKPVPRYFMMGIPVLWQQRTQRCQHHSLELRQLDGTPMLGEHQGENIALFLQAVRVCDVGHNVVELVKHKLHPNAGAETHDSCIEEKHLVEGCGDLQLTGRRAHGRLALGLAPAYFFPTATAIVEGLGLLESI